MGVDVRWDFGAVVVGVGLVGAFVIGERTPATVQACM